MLREVFRLEYGGRVYPFVLIPWEDHLLGVGTVELERILLDENDIPKDQEAINIYNRFAYYVDDEEELQLPANQLLSLFL